MLERDAELSRLDEALGAAEVGSGSLALIEGAAGVGKSALLAQACERARDAGFLVLSAKGDELESSFAFGAAIQLFAEVQQLAEEDPDIFVGAAELAMPLLERGPPPLPGGDPNPAFPLLHGLHWLAAELAALEPGAATSAADALTAAQVLAPGPPLSFVHPIVREAAYADLPPGRRRKAHLAAARLLREAGRSAEEVASQLLAAGPVGEAWAAGVLREAAGQALGRGAPALAARLLRQALEEAEQGDPALLLELGRAEIAAADPAAPRHLEEARAAAREPQQRAMAAGALGQARYVLGDPGGDRATHRARPRRAVARRSRYGSRGDRLGAGTGRREGARERAASDGAGVDGVLPVAAGALRRGAGGCWPRSGAGEPAGQPARARPVPGASAGHLLAARRRQRLPRRCGDASGPKTGGLGDLERIGVLDSLLEVAPPMPRPRRPGQA